MTGLKVLVIDDERPALDELTFLLGRDPRIGEVMGSDSATEALRVLQAEQEGELVESRSLVVDDEDA